MTQPDNTADFIRELRSNEGNFEKLYARLESEIASPQRTENYITALKEIKEKAAEEYKSAREKAVRPGRNLKSLLPASRKR